MQGLRQRRRRRALERLAGIEPKPAWTTKFMANAVYRLHFAWGRVTEPFRSFRRGVRNLWRWAPVVWGHCNGDWCEITGVLVFKLRDMAATIERRHLAVECARDARQMRCCANLFERVAKDTYWIRIMARQNKLASQITVADMQEANEWADRDFRRALAVLEAGLRRWWD